MLIHKSCGKRDVSWKPTSEIQIGEFRGEVGELGLLDGALEIVKAVTLVMH